jgi:hypothetical protein
MLSPLPIRRISPPTIKEFNEIYLGGGEPVVITGLVHNWAALKKWDINFFAQNFGNLKTTALRLKNGESDLNNYDGARLDYVSVEKSTKAISEGRLDDGLTIVSPIDAFPVTLMNDYSIPTYCAKGKFFRSRLFIGPKGAVTSLHQDLFENLYVLVKGKKQISLYKPSSPVYPHSRFSKLPNWSQVDAENPDIERFPLFKNAQQYTVELESGETLFVPSFWWHHIRNMETSIATSFWWAHGWTVPVASAAALYKKLRDM